MTVLVLATAVVTGCNGGGDGPEVGWAEACGDAAARIGALPTTGTRERLGLAAGAIAVNLRDLAGTLESEPSDGDPVAAANLRNGVAQVAVGFEDLSASIRGIGAGGRARVERDVADTYGRIDASAVTLGLPDCRAVPLGSARFTRLQAQATSKNLGESPRQVAQHACRRIEIAYGVTLVPVDAGAALTQLRRSRDVLTEILRDVRARQDPASVRLRTASGRGVDTLTGAIRAVRAGADPGVTTLRAVDATTVDLRDAFRGSGVRCTPLALTPGSTGRTSAP